MIKCKLPQEWPLDSTFKRWPDATPIDPVIVLIETVSASEELVQRDLIFTPLNSARSERLKGIYPDGYLCLPIIGTTAPGRMQLYQGRHRISRLVDLVPVIPMFTIKPMAQEIIDSMGATTSRALEYYDFSELSQYSILGQNSPSLSCTDSGRVDH